LALLEKLAAVGSEALNVAGTSVVTTSLWEYEIPLMKLGWTNMSQDHQKHN
jgi:hypothetical protein